MRTDGCYRQRFVVWLGRAALLLLLPVLVSCVTVYPDPEPKPPEKLTVEEAKALLWHAQVEMKAGRLLYAREVIAPLVKHPVVGKEAEWDLRQVDLLLRQPVLKKAQDVSRGEMIEEAEKALVLPENYNKTIEVDAKIGPFKLEENKMEQLLKKQVEFDVTEADLKALVQKLHEIDGLSVIMDEGLTSDKLLTLKVKQASLREIFDYVKRNMGVDFVVGESVVWVTKGEEMENKGPKLHTEIISLRKGFVPGGGAAGGGGGGGRNPGGGGGGSGRGGRNPGGGGNIGGGFQDLIDRFRSGQGDHGEMYAPLGGGGGAPAGGAAGGGEDDLLDALNTLVVNDPEAPADALLEINRTRNLLMVRNTRENIRLVHRVIEAFDRDPKEVFIEARFVTVKQTDLQELGIKFNNLARGKDLPPEPQAGDFTDPADYATARAAWLAAWVGDGSDELRRTIGNTAMFSGSSGPFLQFTGILDGFLYDFVLSAIHKVDANSTLNAPRLTVINNHPAKIRQGDVKYYYEEFQTTQANVYPGANNNAANVPPAVITPTGKPTKLDLGMTFEVTPSIGNDGKSVTLNLNVDLTDFLGFTNESSGGGVDANGNPTNQFSYKLPNTSESTIQTTVVVNSGQTLVLGGQMRSKHTKTVQKVPWLGDIPYLGILFRHTSEEIEPYNLLIFVTVNIVDPNGRFNVAREPAAAGAAAPLAVPPAVPPEP